MKNKILDETQDRKKIYVGVMNNLSYPDDINQNDRRTIGTREPLDEGERRLEKLDWNSVFKKLR